MRFMLEEIFFPYIPKDMENYETFFCWIISSSMNLLFSENEKIFAIECTKVIFLNRIAKNVNLRFHNIKSQTECILTVLESSWVETS